METQNVKPTKITKTWFIERGNNPNDIFACDEQEAWGLFQNKSNWRRNDFKIVGVSDGQTYVKSVKEGMNEINQITEEVQSMSRDLTRYMDARDKLKFDQFVDDTDERIIRADKIINELQAKVDEKNNILRNAQKYVVDKAFKAELEVARGHIEHPQNFDVFTPHGNRDKILNSLGK